MSWRCRHGVGAGGALNAVPRRVVAAKLGPSHVVTQTPLDNIRITTSVSGEHEKRIIDPARVEPVETHGCRFVIDAGGSGS